MVKNVSVNAVLTPAGNLDLADSMMGKVIQPQPRWSPGSLANSVLGNSDVPLILLLTASSLVALEATHPDLVNGEALFTDLATPAEVFNADASDTKSKTISNGNVIVPPLDLTIDGGADFPETHPIYQILKPERPTFTLLSLVNAMETALLEVGDYYLLVVDQRNTSVTVARYASEALALAARADALADDPLRFGGFAEVVAAFDMAYDISDPGTPAYGWE